MALRPAWMRRLCRGLGMRYRSKTSVTEHVPKNLTEVNKLLLLRLTFLVHTLAVPPSLLFDTDETGCGLLAFRDRGWAPGGDSQVRFQGALDKRQFIVTPTISATGVFVNALQVIWKGTTSGCHPHEATCNAHPSDSTATAPSTGKLVIGSKNLLKKFTKLKSFVFATSVDSALRTHPGVCCWLFTRRTAPKNFLPGYATTTPTCFFCLSQLGTPAGCNP